MSMLRRIWLWLKSSQRRADKKWNPDLNPIDIKKISEQLNLKGEAHRLGTAGVPGESDTMLSGPEASVVNKVEEARTDYMAWGQLRLAGLNKELARKDITQEINQAREADQEFERLAAAELTAKSATLRDLGDIASARKRELDKFKSKHRLDRLPAGPADGSKVLHTAIVIGMIAFEAFINSTFFARGLDTGLVGGFIEAGIAAGVNVGVSFFLGMWLVRYVHHVKISLKLAGWMSLISAACFIGLMALGISHYRDALVAGADDALVAALKSLRAAPFGLKDISSWVLFLLSVFFGIAAVIDGYKTDDPYPGYGKKSRLYEEAIKDYITEIDDLHEYLETAKKDALAQLDRAASQTSAAVAIFTNLIGEKTRSGNDLRNAVRNAEDAMRALLQEFRTENKVARAGASPPAYFNTWPSLRELEMPDFSTGADEKNLSEQRQLLATFVSEIQDIRARIQTAFNKRFDTLQSLDAQFIVFSAAAAPDGAIRSNNSDSAVANAGTIISQGVQ